MHDVNPVESHAVLACSGSSYDLRAAAPPGEGSRSACLATANTNSGSSMGWPSTWSGERSAAVNVRANSAETETSNPTHPKEMQDSASTPARSGGRSSDIFSHYLSGDVMKAHSVKTPTSGATSASPHTSSVHTNTLARYISYVTRTVSEAGSKRSMSPNSRDRQLSYRKRALALRTFSSSLSTPEQYKVQAFAQERKSEARHLYDQVQQVSFIFVAIGVIATCCKVLKDHLPWSPWVHLPIIFGYWCVGVGVACFCICDPEDVNIDDLLAGRPLVKFTVVCLASVYTWLWRPRRALVVPIFTVGINFVSLLSGRVVGLLPFSQAFAQLSIFAPSICLGGGFNWWNITGLAGFLVIMTRLLRGHFFRRKQGARRVAQVTKLFYETLLINSFFEALHMISLGVQDLSTGDRGAPMVLDVVEKFVSGVGLGLAPLITIVQGRRWWYGILARRFNCDPMRIMKDAAFVASLLDSVAVTQGEEWWRYRETKDLRFSDTDPRFHFQRGEITAVEPESFTVEFPAEEPGDVPEVASFPLLRRNAPIDELVSMAKAQLRCMEWESLTLCLLSSGPICGASDALLAANRFLECSRPVRPGERIDFFLSHAWRDDPAAKHAALSHVAEYFKTRKGRYPTFWFDKTCIDQTNIGDGLRVLPMTVMSCNRLLMLYSPQYCERLWCVWELFTIMAFFTPEQALDRIEPVDISIFQTVVPSFQTLDPLEVLCSFQASQAKCFDPNDENRLRKVIQAVGEDHFNWRIQRLGALCKDRTERIFFSERSSSRSASHRRSTSGPQAPSVSSQASLHSSQTESQIQTSAPIAGSDSLTTCQLPPPSPPSRGERETHVV